MNGGEEGKRRCCLASYLHDIYPCFIYLAWGFDTRALHGIRNRKVKQTPLHLAWLVSKELLSFDLDRVFLGGPSSVLHPLPSMHGLV